MSCEPCTPVEPARLYRPFRGSSYTRRACRVPRAVSTRRVWFAAKVGVMCPSVAEPCAPANGSGPLRFRWFLAMLSSLVIENRELVVGRLAFCASPRHSLSALRAFFSVKSCEKARLPSGKIHSSSPEEVSGYPTGTRSQKMPPHFGGHLAKICLGLMGRSCCQAAISVKMISVSRMFDMDFTHSRISRPTSSGPSIKLLTFDLLRGAIIVSILAGCSESFCISFTLGCSAGAVAHQQR